MCNNACIIIHISSRDVSTVVQVCLQRVVRMLPGRSDVSHFQQTLILSLLFAGVISAEMPEAVPRRLLDSASLKLYEATKMAQGYGYVPNQGYGYYGYYGPPPQGGRYPTARLPDLTITLPTTTVSSLPTDEIDPEEAADALIKSAAESAKTDTTADISSKTPSTADQTGMVLTINKDQKANGASSSVISAAAALVAGLVYALAL